MRYTVSALVDLGAPLQRLVDALLGRGIARGRIAVSTLRLPDAPPHPPEALVAVKTARIEEQQAIKDALAAGGGRAIQSAEESSVLDAV
jgi:hypothetical protein